MLCVIHDGIIAQFQSKEGGEIVNSSISVRQIYVAFFGAIIVGLLVLLATTTWYTVDQTEQAAVHTFGKVTEKITEPGLHFKMPWPIQTVRTVSKETFSTPFGYEVQRDGKMVIKTEEAKMLTGDENISLVTLVVQWRIEDIEKFLYSTSDPERVVTNATSAALRGVIGGSKIDEALTDGKIQIETQIRDLLRDLVTNQYNAGIQIMDVKLQNVDLPTEEVRKAFTAVTDAREQKETKINEARKYYNEKYNEAIGTRDAKLSRAEGTKQERIQFALGDVAKYNALLQAYIDNPEVTRKRLVLETLEKILPGAEIYIMENAGDTVKYLPIRPLERGGN